MNISWSGEVTEPVLSACLVGLQRASPLAKNQWLFQLSGSLFYGSLQCMAVQLAVRADSCKPLACLLMLLDQPAANCELLFLSAMFGYAEEGS